MCIGWGMSRPAKSDSRAITRAQAAVAAATTADELRRAQAVLLPALFGATLPQTAAALGIGRATVSRYQAAFRQPSAGTRSAPPRQWGGRRHFWMTLEEEEAFLAPWIKEAAAGSLLVVSPLRAALAQRVGHPVKASVIYRMLARHGWRKVAPDTRHPKSDPAAQEDWKKNSPKRWQPC
jgi:transposase